MKSFFSFFFVFLALCFATPLSALNRQEAYPLASAVSGPMPTIVVDAGHGGNDFGTRGRAPYCEEKRIALQTARLVKKYLNQLGYHVVMTRLNDSFIPLDKRVEIANKAGAALFVSLHYNSARSPVAKGIEIFFYNSKENPKRTASSHRLAHAVLIRLLRRTNAVSRGVKKGNFLVIRETEMPAIIVEGGFISNPEELALLKNPEYIEEISRGVADGIDFYFKKK